MTTLQVPKLPALPELLPSPEAILQALNRIEECLRQRPATESSDLAKILAALQAGIPTVEVLAIGEANVATVAVDTEVDVDISIKDILTGERVTFTHLSITQIDIYAPQLVAADAVRLRLFIRGTRTVPQDIVVEFDGVRDLTGTWFRTFNNRRIEYYDLDNKDYIRARVRNTAGNSAASTFGIRIYGRVFRP